MNNVINFPSQQSLRTAQKIQEKGFNTFDELIQYARDEHKRIAQQAVQKDWKEDK